MVFKSKAQKKLLRWKYPKLYKEFAKATPKGKKMGLITDWKKKSVRKSIGQYKRYHGNTTVGTHTKTSYPYFTLHNRLATLRQVKPAKKCVIDIYEKKIMATKNPIKQNELYGILIEKINE